MTVITLTTPAGRLDAAQRRQLAETLTDAVLLPEVGRLDPRARSGFQVHFVERPADALAVGGRLLSDHDPAPDIAWLDVAVMAGHWPPALRRELIDRLLAALAAACGLDRPAPGWWVNLRVVDEGSWGSRGRVLSMLDLLDSGGFSAERAAQIRAALQPAGEAAPDLPAPAGDGLRRPYGRPERYHLQHVHLFASDLDASIAFYSRWFDGRVVWDGDYGGARNVFMKIGIGAIHFYEQAPRAQGRNAVHHLGLQVAGLHELHARMRAAGLHLPKPVREHAGGGYFMVAAPDDVLLEVFEPGPARDPAVRRYYGLDAA